MRIRALILVAALAIGSEARADTFEDDGFIAAYAMMQTTTAGSLIYLIGNGVLLAKGRSNVKWNVGGLCAGVTAAISGFVQGVFGLLILGLAEDSSVNGEALVWLISGGGGFLVGSLTATFAASVSWYPKESRFDTVTISVHPTGIVATW